MSEQTTLGAFMRCEALLHALAEILNAREEGFVATLAEMAQDSLQELNGYALKAKRQEATE